MILRSVELAIQARDEFMADNPGTDPPMVAASVGPYAAAMHDGSEYTGAYDTSARSLRDFHESRLALLDTSAADLLACETIPSYLEAQVLAELLRDVRGPAWVSFCCRDEQHISDGKPLREAALLFRDHPQVLAVGINCTPPQYVSQLIRVLRDATPGQAIVVYPNSGETFRSADNSWARSRRAARRRLLPGWAGTDSLNGCKYLKNTG